MNRDDLRALTRQRLREARALLEANLPGGAYYLAGYAVECAVKACIAAKTRRYEFPNKGKVLESYTHDLSKLVRTAGLQAALDQEAQLHPAFAVNWATVKDWTEESRYDPSINMQKARDLYQAITMRRVGVIRWLRQHW